MHITITIPTYAQNIRPTDLVEWDGKEWEVDEVTHQRDGMRLALTPLPKTEESRRRIATFATEGYVQKLPGYDQADELAHLIADTVGIERAVFWTSGDQPDTPIEPDPLAVEARQKIDSHLNQEAFYIFADIGVCDRVANEIERRHPTFFTDRARLAERAAEERQALADTVGRPPTTQERAANTRPAILIPPDTVLCPESGAPWVDCEIDHEHIVTSTIRRISDLLTPEEYETSRVIAAADQLADQGLDLAPLAPRGGVRRPSFAGGTDDPGSRDPLG